jgi:two-component system, OmpR family, response regulator
MVFSCCFFEHDLRAGYGAKVTALLPHSHASWLVDCGIECQRQQFTVRILIVEDETRLARHIASALTEAGHDPTIISEGETAIGAAEETSFDLILLDVMLPGIDGFEVLRHLRQAGIATRVLMLTARGQVNDRVTGLQLGADDYLAKPFAMQELLARVRALGRRYAEEPQLTLRVADLVLSLTDQQVHRGSRQIDLSTRELMLLRVLMREPGRVFTRTELCERVWERQHDYDTKLVEVFIGRLRKKLGSPPLIRTQRHIGYSIGEAP